MWSTTVYGSPAPKGSLKPFLQWVGGQPVARLREDAAPSLKGWRKLVGAAGRQILARAADSLLTGPVEVEATVTLARPATVPLRLRWWPWKKSPGHGDADKLGRTILDALKDSRLYTDDAQVCRLAVTKCYPDTPGVVDRLDRPGAVIRVGAIDELPTDLIIPTGHGEAYEVTVDDGRVLVYSSPARGSLELDYPLLVLSPKAAQSLARALDHQARATRQDVLI